MMYLTDTVSGQAYTFLLSIGAGALLGILYDGFKVLRIVIPSRSIIVFFEDIIFWVLAALFSFTFILIFNSGEIRGFIIFGEIVGFFVYWLLFSPVVTKIFKAVVKTIKKAVMLILRIIYTIFIKPFLLIFGIITKPLRRLFVKTRQKTKKVWNNQKNILRRSTFLLYNYYRNRKDKKNKSDSCMYDRDSIEEQEKEFYT